MSHLIYSQTYAAVARTLLRFDAFCNADPWYSPEWHRLITRIAIYESRGFTRVVQFGLTPGIVADMWLDILRGKPATARAMALTARVDPGPWEPIAVMENLPLAILHCRLRFGDVVRRDAPERLYEQVCFYGRMAYPFEDICTKKIHDCIQTEIMLFEAAHPDPKLTLSPEEHRQMSTAPGAKQIGLKL